ncbi:MAG: hypothetical protein J6J17_00745 [Bacilli bacterium]|nr:hypothetical protein [Bacilli bacterium]
MNIKNLNLLKKTSIRKRLCALSLASVMAVTAIGCSNSRSNNSSERQEQTTNSLERTENTTYLDGESPEIYKVESLINGEKRGIILSNEPHLYESVFEKTDTKVYLSDEDGNRLSDNFDEISLLSNYSYLTTGGVLLGSWSEVDTDKQYDYFVGITLRKDSNDSTLNPSVTLLDNNGLELCSFNGYFEALIGNTVVIKNYFEGEDRIAGVPDTYLYDYTTGKTSEKHDYVKIFRYKNNENEETSCLIGVNLYYENYSSNHLYSFYDENLEVVGVSTEEEIKDWYISNDDYYSFSKAGGNYVDYFKSIYQNINVEKSRQLILKKDSESQN